MKSDENVIGPVGATNRVHRLPNPSMYWWKGTAGPTLSSAGVSRSASRSGRRLSISIIGLGEGHSYSISNPARMRIPAPVLCSARLTEGVDLDFDLHVDIHADELARLAAP